MEVVHKMLETKQTGEILTYVSINRVSMVSLSTRAGLQSRHSRLVHRQTDRERERERESRRARTLSVKSRVEAADRVSEKLCSYDRTKEELPCLAKEAYGASGAFCAQRRR